MGHGSPQLPLLRSGACASYLCAFAWPGIPYSKVGNNGLRVDEGGAQQDQQIVDDL